MARAPIRPPSAAWRRALVDASRLGTAARDRAHGELVAAVRGTEGRATFDALIASIRVRHDHGVYEGTYNALWRFPAEALGTWFAEALPAFQARMGRYDQVSRFYGAIPSRRRTRASFVKRVLRLPSAKRKLVIATLRAWSVEQPAWEGVLLDLGAPVAKPPAADAAPPAWPKPWRTLLAQVRAGAKDMVAAWGGDGRLSALPRVIAFMTIDHGPRWREVDALSNPLFAGFAMRHYPAFVAQVRALPADERARLLTNLGKAAPWKKQRLHADLRR
ncbi:MAG: hypothetical protein JNK64_15450 [Myxococcales bacterium]|nr:hypothetical protein [Myxococcales bacterium]